MNNRLFNTRSLTYFAVLVALTVVLQLFANAIPIGAGGASLNFSLLPIVLCGMLLGPWYSLALGLVSGIITTVQVATGQGWIFSIMYLETPFMLIFVCMLKISLAAFLGGFLFKIIKNKLVATFVSSAVVPIVNTGIFIIGMLIVNGALHNAVDEINKTLTPDQMLDASNVLVFILVTLVSFNFFIEFGLNLIIAPALFRAVGAIEKTVMSAKKSSEEESADQKEETESEIGENDFPDKSGGEQ